MCVCVCNKERERERVHTCTSVNTCRTVCKYKKKDVFSRFSAPFNWPILFPALPPLAEDSVALMISPAFHCLCAFACRSGS